MRILLAVISCTRDRDKNEAQRQTCFSGVSGADIRFFLGGGNSPEHDDEVIVDAPDDYKGLSQKVSKMLLWAVEQGYDYVFRMDSDCYVQVDRLLENVPVGHDYCGRLRGPSGTWPAPYASGFAYWLSRKAARIRGEAELLDVAEDRSTGNILAANNIQCLPDYRYAVVTSSKNAKSGIEGPRIGNDIIAACEFTAEGLHRVHQEWLTLQAKGGTRMILSGTPFDDVCVLVKTLLRDGMMRKCVELIEKHMPGARIIIVDDGMESKQKVALYADLRSRGHSCVWMPFDSGFGAKSNEAKKYYDRKYVLVFSDDFEATEKVADDVLRMMAVLEARPDIAVASGRVDDSPYEAYSSEILREDGMIDVVLTPVDHSIALYEEVDGIRYVVCDHTVNYNLVRRDALKRVKWNEEFPIGGDHYDFYKQIQDGGWKVCYVEGVSVSQMHRFAGSEDQMYASMRGRARFALPALFKRNNWASFTAIDGRVDTPESVQKWVDDNSQRIVAARPHERIDRRAMRKAEREARRAERDAARAEQVPDKRRLPRKRDGAPLRRHAKRRRTVAKASVPKGMRSIPTTRAKEHP